MPSRVAYASVGGPRRAWRRRSVRVLRCMRMDGNLGYRVCGACRTVHASSGVPQVRIYR